MKKIFILFFIFIITINFQIFSFADDNDDSIVDDNDILEVSSNSSNEPIIYSKNSIVIDRKTLRTLYQKQSTDKVPMASTTKIMTCLLALENANLTDIVEISENAASVRGSTIGLDKNSKATMNDLLYGLMLRSGNDCAIAIAEHISGSTQNFAELMNNKAKELNLVNTNFVSPHGLDNPNHYTTAYDLALLTNIALQNKKFKEIVSTEKCTINFNNHSQEIKNTNELLNRVEGVYGVKTGFTFEAGRCLVTACNRNNLDIIIVVLGADTKKVRSTDSVNLINYIYNNYSYFNLTETINSSFDSFIIFFEKNYLLEKTKTPPILYLKENSNTIIPLKCTEISNISSKTFYTNVFSPKIEKNSVIGKLTLMCRK